jgi:glycosyltransferase involved in cell wall biosynthesis
MSSLQASTAALVLVGLGPSPPWVPAGGAVGLSRARAKRHADSKRDAHGNQPPAGVSHIAPVPPERLREMYADADVLVAPSIRTPTFLEPWGLVVNEAMNRGLPVIASDAVGAVAGGLVRDGHNGLVVPAGDSHALAQAMARLAADPELRSRLGAAGARDVSVYTHDAWAQGFSRALSTLGLSRTC